MELVRNPETHIVHRRECLRHKGHVIPWKHGEPLADEKALAEMTQGTRTHLCQGCLPGVCRCTRCAAR
jgi:hypothetical protein